MRNETLTCSNLRKPVMISRPVGDAHPGVPLGYPVYPGISGLRMNNEE